MRQSWNDYWMALAFQVSTRATCERRHVGCVIVKNNEVISMGYNGAPSKFPQCDEIGCLKNEQGSCIRTVHAETNALLRADPRYLGGAYLYCTDGPPCVDCAKLIANTGITALFYARQYPLHPYAKVLMDRISLFELQMPPGLE